MTNEEIHKAADESAMQYSVGLGDPPVARFDYRAGYLAGYTAANLRLAGRLGEVADKIASLENHSRDRHTLLCGRSNGRQCTCYLMMMPETIATLRDVLAELGGGK